MLKAAVLALVSIAFILLAVFYGHFDYISIYLYTPLLLGVAALFGIFAFLQYNHAKQPGGKWLALDFLNIVNDAVAMGANSLVALYDTDGGVKFVFFIPGRENFVDLAISASKMDQMYPEIEQWLLEPDKKTFRKNVLPEGVEGIFIEKANLDNKSLIVVIARSDQPETGENLESDFDNEESVSLVINDDDDYGDGK